jgi:hypothetical protein
MTSKKIEIEKETVIFLTNVSHFPLAPCRLFGQQCRNQL